MSPRSLFSVYKYIADIVISIAYIKIDYIIIIVTFNFTILISYNAIIVSLINCFN